MPSRAAIEAARAKAHAQHLASDSSKKKSAADSDDSDAPVTRPLKTHSKKDLGGKKVVAADSDDSDVPVKKSAPAKVPAKKAAESSEDEPRA